MKFTYLLLLFILSTNVVVINSIKTKGQPASTNVTQIDLSMLEEMEIEVHVKISMMMIIQMLIANGKNINMEALSQMIATTEITAKTANEVIATIVSESGAKDSISETQINQCADAVKAILQEPETATVEFIEALPEEVKDQLSEDAIEQIVEESKDGETVQELMQKIVENTESIDEDDIKSIQQIATQATQDAAQNLLEKKTTPPILLDDNKFKWADDEVDLIIQIINIIKDDDILCPPEEVEKIVKKSNSEKRTGKEMAEAIATGLLDVSAKKGSKINDKRKKTVIHNIGLIFKRVKKMEKTEREEFVQSLKNDKAQGKVSLAQQETKEPKGFRHPRKKRKIQEIRNKLGITQERSCDVIVTRIADKLLYLEELVMDGATEEEKEEYRKIKDFAIPKCACPDKIKDLKKRIEILEKKRNEKKKALQ